MILEIISNENAKDYVEFLPDFFYKAELMLGIVCLDEETDTPVGFTMLTLKEESLLIEYIYVIKEYRRRGVGTMMLDGVGEMAEAAGIDTIEVYYDALLDSEDIPGEFLLENGFLISEAGELMEFDSADLLYSDYVKNLRYPKELDVYDCIPIGRISESQGRRLKKRLEMYGGSDFLPFSNSNMSFLCVKSGEEKGCILCSYDEYTNMITIMELIVFSNDPMCTAKLLIALGRYVANKFSHKPCAMFLKTQEFKVALAEKLLGDESKLKSAGVLLQGVKMIQKGE